MDITLENVKLMSEKYGAWQDVEEFYLLIKKLSENPPKIFIELGVWMGGFGSVLKCFFPNLEIIGVDPTDPINPLILPPNTIENVEQLRRNIKEFNINYIVGSSQDQTILEKVSAILDGRKADFLFIDGAHDYDSVKKDFEMWSPYAKLVGFRDLHNEIGPWKYWVEIEKPKEEIRPGNGLGIGLVYVE